MEDLIYVVEPSQSNFIRDETRRLNFGMPSEPLVGTLLKTLAASKPSGKFLELGTGTGLATSWLLAGMDSAARLTSVETDPAVQSVAREALGSDERLTLTLSEGLAFLQAQQSYIYDLVFADAMPGKYEGVDAALAVVKVGGFYVIDDMLPQPNWPDGHTTKIPVLLGYLSEHPDFILLPLVWSSGVAVAVRARKSP